MVIQCIALAIILHHQSILNNDLPDQYLIKWNNNQAKPLQSSNSSCLQAHCKSHFCPQYFLRAETTQFHRFSLLYYSPRIFSSHHKKEEVPFKFKKHCPKFKYNSQLRIAIRWVRNLAEGFPTRNQQYRAKQYRALLRHLNKRNIKSQPRILCKRKIKKIRDPLYIIKGHTIISKVYRARVQHRKFPHMLSISQLLGRDSHKPLHYNEGFHNKIMGSFCLSPMCNINPSTLEEDKLIQLVEVLHNIHLVYLFKGSIHLNKCHSLQPLGYLHLANYPNLVQSESS
ncbi:hypothetical protein FGO68_gene17083 [Halteria grandinella]|uniref:Uncharacterized protein n=1 Tax=Halteria grandinella TaxID=5974 RepID=A0A8J8P0T9_HALGN|nr:hypothetical protein FGO68_gene17083 [Halteria grandinella]